MHLPALLRSRYNTIYHAELGSSASILAAGYNLDCFMVCLSMGL